MNSNSLRRSLHAPSAVLMWCFGIAAQAPDLSPGTLDRNGLTVDAQTAVLSGILGVVVENRGSGAVSAAFVVTAFEDTDRDGTFNRAIDRVFGESTVPSLGSSTTRPVTISVAGRQRFRDNLIHVAIDTGMVIAESDENNNITDTGRGCVVAPGAIAPTLEWSWTASTTDPDSLNVLMTPCVIDLDGDLLPEVVFGSTASTGGGHIEIGILRALDGRNGTERFSVTDPALRINTACSIATGDLDNDGRPEIVACAETGTTLLAFEDDGTFKWRSDVVELISWGAIALADLDEDGDVEIVVGRQALDHNGALLWTGTGDRGIQFVTGPISLVADIDQDGLPEVLAGGTLYSNTGAIEWNAAGEGTNGVANFDADTAAEIVRVSLGNVQMLDDDGSLLWAANIPGGGVGGPPTIADFVRGGLPEIGVAGATRYTVFDATGAIVWQVPVQDSSSNRTGSSVFDFNGDGEAEVVYRDELVLRILRGRDGFELWSTPLSSCTWHEYVLVADVDGDGDAEIVAVANNNCGFGPERGIHVYGSATDAWVATRPIWNQHTYHITNVEDDGRIPQNETNNWLTPAGSPFNNYRQNVLASASPRSAPDLTASQLVLPCVGFGDVQVRVGNGGALFAPAGLSVAFYDGDPTSGGTLLGTAATPTRLNPGDFVDVAVTPATALTGPIFAVADDDGTNTGSQRECEETNNTHSAVLCGTSASWTNYGAGHPGTGGVPALTLDANPRLGSTVTMSVGNSLGQATFGGIFIGATRTNQASGFGGNLLVNQFTAFTLPIPTGGGSVVLPIPCQPEWCGRVLTFQALQWDPGASAAVAFTAGLELMAGG